MIKERSVRGQENTMNLSFAGKFLYLNIFVMMTAIFIWRFNLDSSSQVDPVYIPE